ncbi:hypothetical protein AB2939_004337 [Escherichia coli]|jgi:hypothetical protein|uniref:hypothetical protein n=1 Tax=Enterobacteriaceae TaxID=543 RepID=UPI000BE53F0A|nr:MULTISPECIES: hypothetical protein [Enterobacteriaceae]EAT0039959.1 hypothetical protein [Salmonella enterica]EHG0088617.1 hypothetical protein [Salmonella enterica subsp. enterica serovar Newport]EBA4851871.1 hypothetical protein [Salmonella enterica]EBJ7489524.1 hypothetical protein [Salmonella enterica]ECC5251722.1 hypothetical protein [Salmonella enterica]
MIIIPLPIFIAVTVVLSMGFIFEFNRYVRISSFIIYIGFWLSFKSDDAYEIKSSLNNLDMKTVLDFLYLTSKLLLPIIITIVFIIYMKRDR